MIKTFQDKQDASLHDKQDDDHYPVYLAAKHLVYPVFDFRRRLF